MNGRPYRSYPLKVQVNPRWPDSLLTKALQPTARRLGIKKRIGCHTLRRTYSSLLAATGDDVKVVKEVDAPRQDQHNDGGLYTGGHGAEARCAVDAPLDRKPKRSSTEQEKKWTGSTSVPKKPYGSRNFCLSYRDNLVDLIGIEPMTSSMPWAEPIL